MKAQKLRFSAIGANAYDVAEKLKIKSTALIEMGYPSFNVIYKDTDNLVIVEMFTDFMDDKVSRLLQMFEFYIREYDLEQQKVVM